VHEVDVESEFSDLAEALLQLELGSVSSLRQQLLNGNDVFLGLVNEDEIPVLTLQEWELLGADVSWSFILLEVIVRECELKRDDISGSDFLFTLSECFSCNRNEWKCLNLFLEIFILSLVAVEKFQFFPLLGCESAECLNSCIWDLMISQLLPVFLYLIYSETSKLQHWIHS